MSIEYAGSLFDTVREAQLASIEDWATACGSNDAQFIAGELAHEATREDYAWELIDDITEGDWSVPGLARPKNEDDEYRWELKAKLHDLMIEWAEKNK